MIELLVFLLGLAIGAVGTVWLMLIYGQTPATARQHFDKMFSDAREQMWQAAREHR